MAKYECRSATSTKGTEIKETEKSLIVEEQRKKRLCEEKEN